MKRSDKTNPKRYLNLYFQVHQPRRLSDFRFFDIGGNRPNFDDAVNKKIIQHVANLCYQPANLLLLKLIRSYPQIKITFSISGVALEQIEKFCPEVLNSFRTLASTGSVEFLGETYYHSLCFLTDQDEFVYQVNKHSDCMERLFGVRPSIFRNTELIYSDELGRTIRKLGFKAMYLDGIEGILHDRSPNELYKHPDEENDLKLFLRNYRLSDDIAFRFSDKNWKEYPLTAYQYVRWLEHNPAKEYLINLGMDYETFGEHQKAETDIFKFLKDFLTTVAKHDTIKMITPSEAIRLVRAKGSISVPVPISWADQERDLSAWLGNEMQRDAFDSLNKLRKDLFEIGNSELEDTWRYLQTSDHLYYMSTKTGDDGRVHNHFSPYPSPYEAFMNYMNVLADVELKISNKRKALNAKHQLLKSSKHPHWKLA